MTAPLDETVVVTVMTTHRGPVRGSMPRSEAHAVLAEQLRKGPHRVSVTVNIGATTVRYPANTVSRVELAS